MKNLALTKKLTDEFCLYFTDTPYVPMAAQKVCGHDILLTVEWILFKFYRVVHIVLQHSEHCLHIYNVFVKNSLQIVMYF